MYEIKISVKNLVEFLLRQGSIDSRFAGTDRALEGARIHRRLQKQEGKQYQAEVSLRLATSQGDFLYTVEGRADGIIREDDDLAIIDEIKSTSVSFESIHADMEPLHWAQAYCYAYIYAKQENLSKVQIRLRYYQIDTEKIAVFQKEKTFCELETFYLSLLKQYTQWAHFLRGLIEKRTNSLLQLSFPFPSYRKGQRELAGAVYKTICSGTQLFCQAPTGVGKTISTLFPALKAMGEGKTDRIFYLTAKTITRIAAQDAILRMEQMGAKVKSITLTAKEKICFCETCECVPERCPYANGYYDRIKDAISDILTQHDLLSREKIEEFARLYKICPFEFSLDLSLWCDVIICDYNYLYDPEVYLRRFFSGVSCDAVFLTDEAHNLVDRAREMYSAKLQKSDFLKIKKMLGKNKCAAAAQTVNKELLALKKMCTEERFLAKTSIPQSLLSALEVFRMQSAKWLNEHKTAAEQKEVLSLFFEVRFFLKMAEEFNEKFRFISYFSGKEFSVCLRCLDPSELLFIARNRGKASVLFSATLSPIRYYMDLLGGREEAKSYVLPSPFPEEQFLVLLDDTISTKYVDREQSILPICERIEIFVRAKTGNYIVYFPSYQYMQDVFSVFIKQCPQIHTVIQKEHMDEWERENFLKQFEVQQEPIVGFCVLGGVFSEGIDLVGDRLLGTVIVGVGLPKVQKEQELLREYYQAENNMGFEFAYQFPGMNKVMQAAGRVIRSETDKGAVLLIDRRFTSRSYEAIFPLHWEKRRIVRTKEALQNSLQLFWEQKDMAAQNDLKGENAEKQINDAL